MKNAWKDLVRITALFCRSFLLLMLIFWNLKLNAQTNCPVATGLTVTGLSTSGASVNFIRPTGTNQYVIELNSASFGIWKSFEISNTASTYQFKDLSPATNYYCRIRTICPNTPAGSEPIYSEAKYFTTYAAPACPVATNMLVSDIAATGAKVSFYLTPNASASVIEMDSPGNPNFQAKATTTSNFFVLTGLTSSTVYHYRIKSECTGGIPGYSATGEFKTLAALAVTPVILTAKGKVKITPSGLCERLIILDNGTTIVPVELPAGFTLKDGQYVELSYEVATSSTVTCKEGTPAKIRKISEILVTPTVCNIPVVIAKNNTTPVSYTFKTDAQPAGSKYYWYFGDNGTSDAASPTHTYTANGTFLINLKVLDSAGKVCYGELKAEFLGGTVAAVPIIFTAKGKVKISTTGTCERTITLDNGTVIVPVETVAGFTYQDGQYVELAYEILKDKVITCTAGPAAKISKISVIPVTTVLACTAASNVTAGESTASAVRINFTLPKEITKASLEIKEYNTTNWVPTEFTSLSIQYFDRKELKAATKYYYHIKTVCANGSVNYSPDAYFVTAAAPAVPATCTAAKELSVTNIGAYGVKIIHALPTGISSATLEVVTATTVVNDATVWLSKNIVIPSSYTERGDLLPATKYKYRIKTVCANGGTVTYSALGDFTTTAAAGCSPAYNVKVSEITTTGARINYTLPLNLSSASLEILASNTNAWLSKSIPVTSAYIDLNELKPLTKYYFRIKTICAPGTTAYSPETYFLTTGNKSAEITKAATPSETTSDLTVTCFPNPAKDIISVTIYGEGDQLINVKLSNIYGHVVFEGKFPENTEQKIDVRSFQRGIYVLKVSNSVKSNSIKIVLN